MMLTAYVWSAPAGLMPDSELSAPSAISLPGATSRLYVPSCAADTVTKYWLSEPVTPVTLPVPVLSCDSTKSALSTPVTFSLSVTEKTRVCVDAASSTGSLRSIDVIVGAVVSAITLPTVVMALPEKDSIRLPSVSITS